MRIGVDALSVVPGETGGGETYLAGLLGAMEDAAAARGHDVVVHCTPDNARLFRERGAVRLVPLPVENRSRPRRLLFEHLRYARRLKDDRIDLLFAPGNALPLRLPCPAVLGVQSLHSFLVPEEMSRFRVAYFKRIVPMSARRAARVLCVSEDLRQTLLGVVPDLDPAKVRVVHEGAPTDIVRVEDAVRAAEVCREFGVEPGKFVLFVSSLNPFKRPERAVEAVARIRADRGETWPLLLAGRASDEHRARVVAAAKACGAEDLIRIAGTVDRARLAALYSGDGLRHAGRRVGQDERPGDLRRRGGARRSGRRRRLRGGAAPGAPRRVPPRDPRREGPRARGALRLAPGGGRDARPPRRGGGPRSRSVASPAR
jgi:glycosyltransferase involved in cell wall biosynthesis